MAEEQFREWGILEVMGRLRMAGMISEQTIAGAGMVRIDVPETKSAPAFTRFFTPGSLYSITPTTEEIARSLAERLREMPVTRFELPQLPAPVTHDDMGRDSDEQREYMAEQDYPEDEDETPW